jgi:prepilin-type N-terminal cleavage/methylation domain-containing protein
MQATSSVRRSQGGFTILELMFAITVMLIGLAAAFGGQVGTRNVVRQSRETQLALTQLETVAEAIIAEVPDKLPVAGSAYAHGQEVALPTEVGLRDLAVICTYPGYTAGSPVPNPLQVHIEVTWTDFQGRRRDLSLDTAVSQ